MKECNNCHKSLPINEFYKHRAICKKCYSITTKQYRESPKVKVQMAQTRRNLRKSSPWYKTYDAICGRCNISTTHGYNRYGGRGIKCLITPTELKELWFRDGAEFMEKPSIDRLNSDGHYIKENCRYIEMKENCRRLKNDLTK